MPRKMASHIYGRKSKRHGQARWLYYVRFKDWRGIKRVYPAGKDYFKARNLRDEYLEKNRHHFDFDAPPQVEAAAFGPWVDECLRLQQAGVKIAKRVIQASTLEREVQCCRPLKDFFGVASALEAITPQKISEYEAWRTAQRTIRREKQSAKPVTASTVANELACLRKYLRYAAKRGKIKAAPLIDLPKKGERNRVLRDAEHQKLLKAAPRWLRRLLIVAQETCLSQADILRLNDDMIDLDEGVIVPAGGRAKTGVEQFAPLTPAVRDVLAEIRAERSTVANISKLVFTKEGKPITRFMLRRALAIACKRAGIESFNFHDYRHTAKTKWAVQGIPVEAAMKAAGHRSVQMHNRYVHLQKSDVSRAFKTAMPSKVLPRSYQSSDAVKSKKA